MSLARTEISQPDVFFQDTSPGTAILGSLWILRDGSSMSVYTVFGWVPVGGSSTGIFSEDGTKKLIVNNDGTLSVIDV